MPGTTGFVAPARQEGEHGSRSATTCLVSAGQEGARHVLLDLVAAGLTAFSGPPGLVEEHLRILIEEVTFGRWSPPLPVAVAGITPLPAGALPFLPGDVERHAMGIIVLGPRRAALPETEELLVAARAGATPPLVVGWPLPDAPGQLIAVAGRTPAETLLSADDPGPDAEVGVAILGPVEIRGTAGVFSRRPKLTELVVYLALHPAGSTTSAWATALWPDRAVPAQTVANRLSEARRALGIAPDGRPRLRRTGDRQQLVGVDSDWTTFQLLAAAAEPPESWQRALELVRGRPFEGLIERQWCYLDGFVAEMEVAVVELGLRLGSHLLETGDPAGAQWAATRALKACPFDERLHRLLMRAADAAGSRGGLEEVLRRLALVLEIDGDPLRGVHPQTAALYDHLASRSLGGDAHQRAPHSEPGKSAGRTTRRSWP